MNNKITFPKLATLLADKSGRSKRFSEDFMRELFSLISEQLEAGDIVKVKGIGTFRLLRVEARKSVDVTTGQPMEISGHSKVVFTPAKELAEAINSPFEAFSAIEIGDNVSLDNLIEDESVAMRDVSDEIVLSSTESDVRPQLNVVSDNEPIEEIVAIDSSESEIRENLNTSLDCNDIAVLEGERGLVVSRTDDIEISEESERSEESVLAKVPEDSISVVEIPKVVENDNVDEPAYEEYDYTPVKKNWLKVCMIWAACALCAIVVTFVIWSILTKPVFSHFHVTNSEEILNSGENTESELPVAEEIVVGDINDSVETEVNMESAEDDFPVPTAPSDAVVYDTIGTSRFLTTMAKSHYGNNKFWPYIYEENKANIGHPDRIRPGTPIVIPKLSKYGVSPDNPADVEKANKLAVEIYARYGKKI